MKRLSVAAEPLLLCCASCRFNRVWRPFLSTLLCDLIGLPVRGLMRGTYIQIKHEGWRALARVRHVWERGCSLPILPAARIGTHGISCTYCILWMHVFTSPEMLPSRSFQMDYRNHSGGKDGPALHLSCLASWTIVGALQYCLYCKGDPNKLCCCCCCKCCAAKLQWCIAFDAGPRCMSPGKVGVVQVCLPAIEVCMIRH